MIRNFLSMYVPSYPAVLVYMLQSTEYEIEPYFKWVGRTKDFTKVRNRRDLDRTAYARQLLFVVVAMEVFIYVAAAFLVYAGIKDWLAGGILFGIALGLAAPIILAYLAVLPVWLGRAFISGPKEQKFIEESAEIFAKSKAVKLAVAGSYGKTTMKELLNAVLAQGLKVAATPANKNVSTSHAIFAKKLDGDEDVLIIEYGEGAPGDVAKFAELTKPTHAIITGLAPAHLDHYKTLQAAGEDIFSVASYVDEGKVYVNLQSDSVKPFLKDGYQQFDNNGAMGWKASKVKTGLSGTSFELCKGKRKLKLSSKLVGKHQVGYLAFVAALAIELGLTAKQVTDGVAETKPFEHRMQPYQLNGAWIIDDTYNGNLEGIKAGTELLKDLPSKRKIYVTPGLVDQGEESSQIHREVGKLIAVAEPDVVVLMENSAANDIHKGLKTAGYDGKIQIESRPLEFYTNLKHFVADGDLVVMQNDWTDNYA